MTFCWFGLEREKKNTHTLTGYIILTMVDSFLLMCVTWLFHIVWTFTFSPRWMREQLALELEKQRRLLFVANTLYLQSNQQPEKMLCIKKKQTESALFQLHTCFLSIQLFPYSIHTNIHFHDCICAYREWFNGVDERTGTCTGYPLADWTDIKCVNNEHKTRRMLYRIDLARIGSHSHPWRFILSPVGNCGDQQWI